MSRPLEEVNFDLSSNTGTSAVDIKKELDVLLESFNSKDVEAVPSIQNQLNKVGNEQTTVAVVNSYNRIWKIENEKNVKIENDFSTSETNPKAESHSINIYVDGSEEEIKYKCDFDNQCHECKLCGHITESSDSLEHHLKVKHDLRVKLAQYEFEDVEIDIKHHNLSYECLGIEKNEDMEQVIMSNQSDNEENPVTLSDACNELTQLECEKDIENECTDTAPINGSDNEHNENFKLYQCRYCTFHTTLKAELNAHSKCFHKNKRYICLLCDYKTKGKKYLEEHRKKHDSTRKKYNSEIKWFHCEVCTHKTKSKSSLTRHFRKKHVINNQFCCVYCNFKAEIKSSLKSHFRMKHDKYARWYNCCLCLLRTKSQQRYRQHLKEKHASSKYECKFCEYTTPRICNLRKHIKVKHDENAVWLMCTLCDYETKLKARLVVHYYASHTTTKRFECKICKHTTKYKADLRRHYAIKHDENAQWYHCDLCGYKTKARHYLITHFSLQHRHNENTLRYQCEFCEQKMKSKTSLNRHIKFKHKECITWLYCKVCEFKTKSKSHLNNHINSTHSEFCEIITPRKQSLKKQFVLKQDEDAEWLICALCDYKAKQKSKLVSHLYASHTATKRYKCKICKHRTKYKADLKRHYVLKHDESAQWYYCDLCEYKSKAKLYLIRHFNLQHRPDENTWHQCQFCEQKMKSKIFLNRHIKFKHKESIGWSYCKACKFKTKCKSLLNNHIQSTHSEGVVQDSGQ